MGGKHKVANRTKNNARPSSSGRSAELLGSSIPQFVGFSGAKDAGFSLSGFSLSTTEELDASLDPNIQLVLKKITKKDSTTKLKGLQEFAELVKNSDQDTVKAILPVWPRFYSVLVTDIDNRVREATHNVHHEIILKAKRNIAPYLKQVMAPWFTSQYDTYPPAASAASQAFKDAFPINKFQEAVVYCQEEILSYINDNLLVQTAQTLSNTKHVSPEDAEAKYERVLISCLQGYCLYLEKVPKDQIENMATLNNEIVSNGKFWKLAKHKTAPIRSAWFKVLAIICQKAMFLLDGKGAQVVGTVFGNLEENEPMVLPYVWEAALLTMSSIKVWWTFINIDKAFFPKLWKILKHGGQGNASVIYPSLLPLISHLPATVDENAQQFYNTFFENLRLGLKQKTVIASRSESVAVATAFIECLQYVILKKQSDLPLCKTLISNHLLTTIEWCLTDDQANYKSIFNQVSTLVQYWSRNSMSESLNACLEFFFENISDLFRETLFNLKNKSYNLASVSSKQIEFLQSLKHISKPKKQFKVKFSCDDTDGADTSYSGSASIIEFDKVYFERLNLLVYSICDDYLKYIEESNSKELLEPLCSLIVDFNTSEFFVNLNEKLRKKDPNSKLIDIYNNLLYKWLRSEELQCKQVVDLIFLLFVYVNNEDKELILRTLSEVSNDECLGWCISEALSHPHNKDPIVKEWLHNDKVSQFMVSIAEKEINDDCPSELSVLFKLALTENEDGELFVRKEAILQIIDKLTPILENYADYSITIDTCASLSAYISAIIYTENLLLTYGDKLLLSLFNLSCKFNINNEVLSLETIYEVNSAWQDAVTLVTKNLSTDESRELTTKFADVVEKEFLSSNLEDNFLKHLTDIVVSFLRAVYRSKPLALTDFLSVYLERAFVPELKSDVVNLCIAAEYIMGNLSSPFTEIAAPSADIKEGNVLKYLVWTYFKLSVVASELEDGVEEGEEEDETETAETKHSLLVLNVLDNGEELVSQILYDLSLGRCYWEIFKNVKHYDQIVQYYFSTEIKIQSTLSHIDDSFTSNLKQIFKEKCISEAWFWCKSAYILYTDITPEPITDIYKDFVKDVSEQNSLAVLHLTQTFKSELNYDYIQNKFDAVGNIIILRSLIHCEEIDVQIAEVFEQIKKIRSENVPQFLYSSSSISWEKTHEIIEIVRLCSELMSKKFSSLSPSHWDFGVLCLVSWASNCLKARAALEKYQFQALLTAVVNLYISADNQIKKMKNEQLKSNYIDEWEDVLVESVHGDLAQLWLYVAEQLDLKQDNIITFLPLIMGFGVLINNIRYEFIFKINDTSLPKWSKFLKRSYSLLVCHQPNLQLWGYKMLFLLVPGLIKIDTEAVSTNTPHKKGLIFEQFKEKLVETHEIVNSMLMGYKLGEDSCKMKDSTDSFTYAFAYLLLWDILLTLCEQSSTELRYQYADWLRNEDLLTNFLNNLFKLMPTGILHYNEVRAKSLVSSFLERPILDVRDECISEKIEFLVCWLYNFTLAQLPALVRQWWTSLETKVAQVVEKVTSVYVSPHLCVQELNDVMAHQTKFKNMTIRVIHSAREVVAVYTVDEAQMELVITLPANYPLGGLDVQCNRQIGGTTHKQWLLQLKKCVLHQNGRIWDGLSLWNNNLDKKFDGVEECYICFSVLHPGTYQLPKLSCQTCKKKFHSACLYKWFSTSNKSSCPICRNLF